MNIGASMEAAASAAFRAADAVFANAPASGKFVVNHDNVLAAAKIIQAQVDSLDDRTSDAKFDLVVDGPGDDVVSAKVAESWNQVLVWNDDSYAARVQEYVGSLNRLVTQLIDTAKAYGYNDADIASSLGDPRA
jgi:hypothetical protein